MSQKPGFCGTCRWWNGENGDHSYDVARCDLLMKTIGTESFAEWAAARGMSYNKWRKSKSGSRGECEHWEYRWSREDSGRRKLSAFAGVGIGSFATAVVTWLLGGW